MQFLFLSLITDSFPSSDEPHCKEGQRTAYPASIGQLVDITCHVDANPRDVAFWWGRSEHESSNQSEQFTQPTSKLESVYKVNVESRSDFTNYSCKARNSRGIIKESCIFSIVPEGERQECAQFVQHFVFQFLP